MRIAVDAMGGDDAPGEIVAGTVDAASHFDDITKLYLVGDHQSIQTELDNIGSIPSSVEIVHASEVVGMGDSPAIAIRRKKDSSIGRAVDLVKQGDADAVFSAGNTGAAVAATTLKLRTLDEVERPAIATVMPTPTGTFVLLDAGATPDCTATMLVQFAVMGSVYSKAILGVEKPSVGLLSIGEEAAKGNDITKETFRLLERTSLNFVGNVESGHLFEGHVDVVVCDGFVGNVVLKTGESVARAMGHWLKAEFTRNPVRMLGALLLRNGIRAMKNHCDPAVHGGAPLLGVNGICIIGHGSSSALAARNAVRVARDAIGQRLNHVITDEVRKIDELL